MTYEMIQEAAGYVCDRIGEAPRVGIILGSGLGDIAGRIENKIEIPYAQIPHFARSTAPGHRGQLVYGTLSGVTVLCMQGRLHYYEGHSMESIIFPIRVMKLLGSGPFHVRRGSFRQARRRGIHAFHLRGY